MSEPKPVEIRERGHDPTILAVLGGIVAEAAVEKLVDIAADRLIRPADRGSELLAAAATYKMYKGPAIDAAIDAIRTAFFEKPRDDETGYNVDYDKFRSTMDKILYSTIILQALVGDDASELTMEMLQEALSNALQFSLGGRWALMAAYSIGNAQPMQLYMSEEDSLHPYTRANLDLWTGQLIHGLAAVEWTRIVARWRQLHSGEFERRLYDGLALASAPHLALAAVAAGKALEGLERYIDMAVEAAMVLFRRVNDTVLTLKAAYNDYRSGILSEGEFMVLARSLYNSLQAIEEEVNNLVADAFHSASDMSEVYNVDGVGEVNVPADAETALTQLSWLLGDLHTNTASRELAEEFQEYMDAVREARDAQDSPVKYKFIIDGVEGEA